MWDCVHMESDCIEEKIVNQLPATVWEKRLLSNAVIIYTLFSLCSGPRDHVFINFVDHGAPGLVAFPTKELHASELIRTLKKLHHRQKFAQVSKFPL